MNILLRCVDVLFLSITCSWEGAAQGKYLYESGEKVKEFCLRVQKKKRKSETQIVTEVKYTESSSVVIGVRKARNLHK